MINIIITLLTIIVIVNGFRLIPYCSFNKYLFKKSLSSSNLFISRSSSLCLSSSSSSSSSKEVDEYEAELKKEAMDMLECLTSPRYLLYFHT
jgi:hypothetical protein